MKQNSFKKRENALKKNALEIHFDYETRSEVDIKKSGAYLYAVHPSTEIICMSYQINDGPIKLWTPDNENDSIEPFLDKLGSSNVMLKAHNALFEYYISHFVLPKYTTINNGYFKKMFPIHQFRCTAAKAAACALPRNLGKVGAALNLPLQKDKRGDALIKRYSKPRQVWKKWKEGGRIGPEPEKYFYDEEDYAVFYDYCKTDVKVEKILDKTLPDLTPREQKVWELNALANTRGVTIDVSTVKQILLLIEEYEERLTKESKELCGFNVTQRNKVLEWLNERGAMMTSLDKKAVTEALESGELTEEVQRVLEIRQALSKSSTKKYQAMLTRTWRDGRARDLSLYHGASTGREAGQGIQFQNLPKGSIKNPEEIIERIQKNFSIKTIGKWDHKSFNQEIELEYGSPLAVYSSLVRSCITASKSKRLFLADYNAIEARVLAWLAGQKDLLADFESGADPYVKQAADIYKIPESEVTPAQRQFGKTVVLACGFGQGANGLFKTCQDWGVSATLDLCKRAITSYRRKNQAIVSTWYSMERAIIQAITRNVKVRYKGITFNVSKGFLWCELPSGRKLAYYKPSVRNKPSFGGVMKPTIFFWAEHPKKKIWCEQHFWHGAIIENLVQAIARDVTVEAMQRCEAKDYQYLFMVHDEVNSESEHGTADEYKQILEIIPSWAKGLPLKVEAETSFRYKK